MFRAKIRALALMVIMVSSFAGHDTSLMAHGYYLSDQGNDSGDGSEAQPWRSLQRLARTSFLPGDEVWFKCGSTFNGGIEIDQPGTETAPIIFGSYGSGATPVFANTNGGVMNGNAIRVNAQHVIVQQLSFRQCPANAEAIDVRQLGAVFLTTNADQVIVRDCEMTDTPVGITVYGQHDLITSNYIHDANKSLKPYWGPMGVVLCSSHDEIAYNRFINYCAPSAEYGHDGGAIEINDRGLPKEDISIHHNLSLRNQGFIEWVGRVPPVDPHQNPAAPAPTSADGGSGPVVQNNFAIHHNVCMDYQSFLGLTGPCTDIRIENNTVIRTLAHAQPDSEDVVFWEYFGNRNVRFLNNIFVWDARLVEGMYSRGHPYHDYNLYYRIDGTNVPTGPNSTAYQRRYLGGGAKLDFGEKIGDPLFRDFKAGDFRLAQGSPAIGAGTALHYDRDFAGNIIPTNRPPSIGAYEAVEDATLNSTR